ncbi:MAG: DNA adenine methylase [Comamonadaceae bacterium]|nr:MAG: DNA adenine methylase [Comamonadaceae bacterium]
MIGSPLRYPGGKAKLFDFFVSLIEHNRLLGCRYCEPYAGGAGLALKLLSGGFVESVALNDVDEAIWAFWTSALNHNQDLCHLVENATLSIDEWYRQREVWRAKDLSDPLALGFATFFLNRTNRSGIIEGAGPVGGYEQGGRWRLDARFDRVKQAASISALAPFQSRISVSRLDALEFIEETLTSPNTLTYLDPPYYVKGSKLYRNAYNHDDHVAVKLAVAGKRSGQWVVSYDAVEPILEIYSDWDPILYSLSYSAGASATGKEVIFLSDALSLPEVRGFTRLAA